MMRVPLLLAAASALMFTGSASAADLPAPAPMEEAAPIYDWTGFYVGLHVGGAWPSLDIEDDLKTGYWDDMGLDLDDDGGLFGGIQVGYNIQSGNWVFGLEGDFSGADLESNDDINLFNVNVNWLATARARVGYAWDEVLVYVTGGGAFADVEAGFENGDVFSDDQTQFGWAAGAGLEWGFTENASVKLEYMFYSLESDDPFVLDDVDTNIDLEFQTVKVGVNYRF